MAAGKKTNGKQAAATAAPPAKAAPKSSPARASAPVAKAEDPAPANDGAKAKANGQAPVSKAVPAKSKPAPKKPAAKAPAAEPTDLKVFQIYFEPWQRDLLDPAFVPLDNRGQPTELLEFDLFERLSISNHVENVKLWGALSWRFSEKTGLTGADMKKQIEEHPDLDIYFCNPFPIHEALYHNLWLQGETAHPRFLELVRAFFAAAGLPDDSQVIVPSQLYSSANYFVGSKAFWAAYIPWIRTVLARADANLPPEIKRILHSAAADDRNIHAGQSYMPFIVERLFPLFMRTAGKDLKGYKFKLTLPEEEINVHLRLLREMKDMAWQTKNVWLGACWVNYRNLYLQQYHGREWTQKYLRAVTPTEIRFA